MHKSHFSCEGTISLGILFSLLTFSTVTLRVRNVSSAEVLRPSTSLLGAVALSTCALPGIAQPARCGQVQVAENPEHPTARRLQIGFAVVPALGGHPRRDPIAVLMGGPGEDAIGAAEFLATRLAPLRHDFDLLLIDQRGTGRSDALYCDLFSDDHPEASLRDVFPLAAVQNCERVLSARTDLTQYTFDRFANDLEVVRRTLGYGPLNLFAGSYGTRAAQVYIRLYPHSVRTAYMGSVVPIDVVGPLPFAKTEQMALAKMFDQCAADSACNSAFPHLVDEFRQIAARLSSGTVRVSVGRQSGTAPLSGGRVAEWFRSKLYRPYSSTDLPWVIHRAYEGDWSPISEGILSDARVDPDFSFGLFFSITCSEDIPFLENGQIATETEGTFLADYRVRQQQAACQHWPKASLPDRYREPVQSPVPTLFVSGDSDGGTPLWFMERAARGFSHSREIVLRGQGHTEWNDCIALIYLHFVRSGSVDGLGPSTCPPVPHPPFKTQ